MVSWVWSSELSWKKPTVMADPCNPTAGQVKLWCILANQLCLLIASLYPRLPAKMCCLALGLRQLDPSITGWKLPSEPKSTFPSLRICLSPLFVTARESGEDKGKLRICTKCLLTFAVRLGILVMSLT